MARIWFLTCTFDLLATSRNSSASCSKVLSTSSGSSLCWPRWRSAAGAVPLLGGVAHAMPAADSIPLPAAAAGVAPAVAEDPMLTTAGAPLFVSDGNSPCPHSRKPTNPTIPCVAAEAQPSPRYLRRSATTGSEDGTLGGNDDCWLGTSCRAGRPGVIVVAKSAAGPTSSRGDAATPGCASLVAPGSTGGFASAPGALARLVLKREVEFPP